MSAAPEGTVGPATTAVRVTRSRRPARVTAVVAVVAVVVLAYLPYAVYEGTTDKLVDLFILLTMATMWNLLAGYAGLVSVGQQAFIGLGAYFVLYVGLRGASPFVGLPVAALGCAVLAFPISLLVFRLRGGYFAIATWVVADTCQLLVSRSHTLGSGTGAGLKGFADVDHTLLSAYVYWAALTVAVVALATAFFLLRSRVGLVLTAVRDNEVGARSVGARVTQAKRLVYLVAAAGCGAAGAILAVSQKYVQPQSVFSVQWSAQIIFVTVIGGIGSIEGPIIGTVLFFTLQQTLAQYGAWYLIILGTIAIAVALFAPRGIWGLISGRTRLRPFPVGYWLWPPHEAGRRRFGSRKGSLSTPPH